MALLIVIFLIYLLQKDLWQEQVTVNDIATQRSLAELTSGNILLAKDRQQLANERAAVTTRAALLAPHLNEVLSWFNT